jgi:hypothetical protein
VHPVPDPLLLLKSGSAENRTRASGSVARNNNNNNNNMGHISTGAVWFCYIQHMSVVSSLRFDTNIVKILSAVGTELDVSSILDTGALVMRYKERDDRNVFGSFRKSWRTALV